MSENSSSCTVTDGNVTFSNTNHSEWNQKKHDMMLNLGLTNINSDADQTPTPTRFIRNCEEVGLFQDLQNVNPFDEVFKNAVENPSAVSLKLPVSSSDDTLHTPQIYPHLEENSKFSNAAAATSNDYSLTRVISTIEHEDEGDKPLIIVLEPENNEVTSKDSEINKAITTPIKTTSRKVSKDKIAQNLIASMQTTSGGLTPIPIDKLIDHEKQNQKITQNDGNMGESFKQREVDILRQREANKAAQSRCRKRKQREFEQMNDEMQNLRRENLKLTGINLYLQETIKKLESELKAVRSSSSPDPNVLPSSTSPSKISQIVIHNQSTENNQPEKEPVVIGNKVKVNICPKEPSKLPPIAPNVKTVVLASPNSLALPIVQRSSNKTVVVLYPRYMPSQSVIVPPSPVLTRPLNIELKSKSKTSCKRLVPK